MVAEVQAIAHGKVNLHLGVGKLREDGYHDLVTIFQSVALHDVLTVRTVDGPGGVQKLSCSQAGVPLDHTNLAWRAAATVLEQYAQASGKPAPSVELELHKGIPTAGGMAGGSADAAAALVACNHLLGNPFDRTQLLTWAAALGSDVPFTLMGGTALGTGRGEVLTPVLTRTTLHFALAFAREGLSTPAVFRKLDSLAHTPHLTTTALQQALLRGDVEQVAAHIHNDMQPAALSLAPGLRRTLEVGTAAGALAGFVSGSGPTCAFVCASENDAHIVAQELAEVAQVTTTTGVTTGAHVKGEPWPI
ncbi:4-(cytidine 5'-diphospho)-2-C-methyl-D-erythritol kinase [Corynebacterium sp. HS2168-gen11]|uniref:4-(cytidine 5'-diphospho)-2-C-methyl-D-erythritol kinase n=1 Tax=Corynebacterium sp. HS2168-gen11 TaxID=2974027 RepID=UPI00216AE06D|nr:4-(cytidine 5'-diphospho)-2-C-methyl-D-erythritol kinase [Corynebacterium sp. HS2168-gen11]MCS4536364.1 4-(cytidine 5'-diphospho)-2-C-methyl-D-erythritol kinase [Corynebacterium sp. HS2168-gen11]